MWLPPPFSFLLTEQKPFHLWGLLYWNLPEQRLPVPTGVSELQRLLREVNKVNRFNTDRWNLGERLKEAVVSRV